MWGAVLLGLVWLAGWALRSEPVLGAQVQRQAAARGWHIEWDHLGPVGFWGIALTDVRAWPEGAPGDVQVQIDALRLTPDLVDWWQGGRGLGAVVVENLQLQAPCDDPDLMNRLRGRSRTAEGSASGRAGRGSRLPDVRLTGGALTCVGATPDAVAPSVRLDALTIASGDDGGVRLDGRVDIDGLGHALVAGDLRPGEPPLLSLRMLEDHDVFDVVPSPVPIDDESTFSLGAVELTWPPRLRAGPVSVRRLSMRLPGLESWQVENIWGGSIEVRLLDQGYRLVARDLRLRLQGLLRASDVRFATLTLDWNYVADSLTVGATIADPAGRTLDVWAERTPDAIEVRAASDGMDVSALTPLLSSATTGVVSGGEFRGNGRAAWTRADHLWRVQGSADITRLRITSPILAEAPVDIAQVGFGGALEHDTESGAWRTRDVQATLGRILVKFDASRESLASGPVYRLAARLMDLPLQSLVEDCPEALAQSLRGFVFGGTIGARMDAEFNVGQPDASRVVVSMSPSPDLGVRVWNPDIPVHRLAEPNFVQLLAVEGDNQFTGPGAEGWVPIENLPEHVWRAVVAAEDDGFFRHNGFDMRGIEGAIRANLEAGRLVRGGSTISQQVVKNLFLSHDRSVGRKFQEIVLTWLLEQQLSKQQILGWYLNLANWGEGTRGIREAAQAYFDRPAEQLSLRESVFLAAILPNPVRFGRQYARGELEEPRRIKMRNILVNLHRSGAIDDATLAESSRLVLQGLVSLAPLPTHLLEAAAADSHH